MLNLEKDADFVEYFVFTNISHNEEDVTSTLEALRSSIIEITKPYTDRYIWHKEKFNLTPRPDKSVPLNEKLPFHLWGITSFDENIEDEWFIVFLLLQASIKFSELIIRVVDNDGEFLLIEAADGLKKWASPETCAGRVYIRNGEVYIINPDSHENVTKLDMSDAIKIMENGDCKSDVAVTQSIYARLSGYPERIIELQHKARAYIPASIAALLNIKPDMIAPAVHAFCNRDLIDKRVCKYMKHFQCNNRVMRSVKFTKFLYAMIIQCSAVPDLISGWSLPSISNSDFKAHLLGFKIAAGFEILISQDKSVGTEVDLSMDKHWHEYSKTLDNKGYFKGLIRGSKEYKKLEKKAQDYYISNVLSSDSNNLPIKTIMSLLQYDIEQMQIEETSIPESDGENWMELTQIEMDKILENKFIAKKDEGYNNDDAKVLSSSINKFLNKISDVEGVEESEDESEDEMMDEDNSEDDQEYKNEDGPFQNSGVSFNPDEFQRSIMRIMASISSENDDKTESNNSDEDVDLTIVKNDGTMEEYYKQMDQELSTSTIPKSFVRNPEANKTEDNSWNIDMDMNALKNVLESYETEQGIKGPASIILKSASHYERKE